MKYVESRNNETYIIADTLEELRKKYPYIGFVPEEQTISLSNRYMVCVASCKIYSVNVQSIWSSEMLTDNYPMSCYRVFETASELYEWLKGKDEK